MYLKFPGNNVETWGSNLKTSGTSLFSSFQDDMEMTSPSPLMADDNDEEDALTLLEIEPRISNDQVYNVNPHSWKRLSRFLAIGWNVRINLSGQWKAAAVIMSAMER